MRLTLTIARFCEIDQHCLLDMPVNFEAYGTES